MVQRSLIFLKYKDGVPMVASCSVCHRKFFTLVKIFENARMAEKYLLEKFDQHECSHDGSSSSAAQN